MLCLGRILTSKSLTQKRERAATVAALDLRACSAAEGRQHSAGACACASAVPAAAGRRSACSRLAAGGQRCLPPLLPRAKPPPQGRPPGGTAPPAGAASRAEPPAEGAALTGNPAPAGAPTRSGSAASGRAACRRGQRPRPAAQAAASRVAAAAAAKGSRALGFFWEKDSFAPQNLRNSSFCLLAKL
ncbi:hypothetical protein ECC01_21255 [Bacillus tequilensis]|nr:hypothetical protein [Bacillus tequilensis]